MSQNITNCFINGLDVQAAQTWIYPTNYPLRDYQFNIIQQALRKNTLVSLPTGLGKTFIAAVVMYNIYRWFPHGKVIFMAPTRPLVKQQVEACYNIMAIPEECTAELTGTKSSELRKEIWREKRVFFLTPQVLQNDLEKIVQLGSQIKCLVFDEAHKAKGSYAYCEVIKKLAGNNFRVLALSATPGKTINDIKELIQSLKISHLEFRTEESLDVAPYVHQSSLETVVVPLSDKLYEIREKYVKVLEVFVRPLLRHKIFQGNCSNLTKGKIFLTMKEFQQKGNRTGNFSEIIRCLNMCVTLYHAFELLIQHGLRSFLNFFDEHISKPLFRGNMHITSIMEEIRNYLGPPLNVEQLPDGSYTEIPEKIKFGHPKYYKLRDILLEHFNSSSNNNTRAIVFFEYRESVMEAFALLLQHAPQIKPRIFLGQKAGITQKTQVNVVRAFRQGDCNVLLSTCIGEEGLDVGEVDLIVCFDICSKSPIRMVQRMGRTGRKKAGNIVVLVTEGKEQQTLKDCLIHKSNISHHVLTSTELKKHLSNNDNDSLLPSNLSPKCHKIFITVKKPLHSKKSLFGKIQDIKLEKIQDNLPETCMLFKAKTCHQSNNNWICKNLEKQRVLHKTFKVTSSSQSKRLVNLLQLAESKRFNLPVASQISQNNKILKQGDIRSMFQKKPSQDTALMSKGETSEGKEKTGLLNQLGLFVSLKTSSNQTSCTLCPPSVNCTIHLFKNVQEPLNLRYWACPDTSILSNITSAHLKAFTKNLLKENCTIESFQNEEDELNDAKLDELIKFMEDEEQAGNEHQNRSFDLISKEIQQNPEESFAYTMPNNFNDVLKKIQTCKQQELTELLGFFKLKSLEELFEEKKLVNSRSLSPNLFSSPSSDETSTFIVGSSQRLKSFKRKLPLEEVCCKKLKIETPVQFGCSLISGQASTPVSNNNEGKNKTLDCSVVLLDDFCNISDFNLDQRTVEEESSFKEETRLKNDQIIDTKEAKKILEIDDICDLSIFGLKTNEKSVQKEASSSTQEEDKKKIRLLVIDDICDLSVLELDKKTARPDLEQTIHIEQSEMLNTVTITQALDLLNDYKQQQEKSPMKTPPKPKKNILATNKSNIQKDKPEFFVPAKTQNHNEEIFKVPQEVSKSINSSASRFGTSSDDEFEQTKPTISKTKVVTPNNKKRKVNEFIDHEAALSEDSHINVSSDEESNTNLDRYEESFVTDSSILETPNTQMHANYLQSIRSPKINRRGFKIPQRPKLDVSYIFSQEVPLEENTYMDDSFVVDEVEEPDHNLSELEILEMKLKKKRKDKKRKRIVQILSDDSD